MFSTFTKDEGSSLIIRTENLQRIEDTAAENYARLQSEELRLIEAAAERQRRYDGGLPLMPVARGRAGR